MNIQERNLENMFLQALFNKNNEITQREQEIEILRQELLKFKNVTKKSDVRRNKLSSGNTS